MSDQIKAKRALLRALDAELNTLVARFLSPAEQLRVRSINEEQDRLETELRKLGVEP